MVSQSPLLVQTTSYAKKFCSFYSIPEKRAYRAKMSYFWGLTYLCSSSGYLIMKGTNKLQLMNPFIRKQMIIDTSAIEDYFCRYGPRVLLTFVKGSNEYVVVASCTVSCSLHVYQSRYSRWVTYSKRGNPWTVLDFVVLHNTIYVLTNKAEIGVLSLNSTSLKLLELKNMPNGPSFLPKLLTSDGKLLVVFFEQNKLLDVYMIDFSTMSYVKLETLGDLALFFSYPKSHALSNPGKWGYESNCVYYINTIHPECEVYSGSNNEMIKCIVPADSHRLPPRSQLYWLDWCFQNQHDEVDYSMVQ